jgi:DNA-directed RNA polymerase subunit RPC12/RpoP
VCHQGRLQQVQGSSLYQCSNCPNSIRAEEAAELYASQVLGYHPRSGDDEEGPVAECPSCHAEALVDLGWNGRPTPQQEFACFDCQETWDPGMLIRCLDCRSHFELRGDPMARCPSCSEDKVQSDPS